MGGYFLALATAVTDRVARISERRPHDSAKFEVVELLGMSDKEFRTSRRPDFAVVFQDSARSLNPTA